MRPLSCLLLRFLLRAGRLGAAPAVARLTALATRLARLFGRELVRMAALVRGLAAHAGDLALLLLIHGGEAAIARMTGVLRLSCHDVLLYLLRASGLRDSNAIQRFLPSLPVNEIVNEIMNEILRNRASQLAGYREAIGCGQSNNLNRIAQMTRCH